MINFIKQINRKRKIKRHSARSEENFTKEMNMFKVKYPECIIFDDIRHCAPGFYSCNYQDYIIYNSFFKNKIDGIFFDVGGESSNKL